MLKILNYTETYTSALINYITIGSYYMSQPQNNKPLTFKTVENMKPKDKDKSDTGENRGLRVSCGKTGGKTFFYRYKSPVTEKLTQVKIGTFPNLSLADARVKLQDLKEIRREGRCPSNESKLTKQTEKLNKQAQEAPSFLVKDLIELYLTQYIEDRKTKNGKKVEGARKAKGQYETRRLLYCDVIPTMGNRLADDITRKDVINMIMEIIDTRSANVQAGCVLRELSSAYEFAIGLDKFSDQFANPALLAKASLKRSRVRLTAQRGKRFLSEQETILFLKWLPGSAYTQTQKNVLRMALWTACRTGELCAAKWSDIDLEKGTFHIAESKTDASRNVQLPTQAITFLKSLQLSTGQYLFASQKTGLPIQQKQLTEQAWRLRADDRALDIPKWTPHDLRRTVRTHLSRIQCPSEVAEAILGHSRSGIEGTYDLHRYEPECKTWLQKWADYLDHILLEA